MGGLDVLVAVVASGLAGAWGGRLLAGAIVSPMLILGATLAPPQTTEHWWIVLVSGALLQAALSTVALVMLLPLISRQSIALGPAFAAMLVGDMVGGGLFLWMTADRLSGLTTVVPAEWVIAASCALLGTGLSAVLVRVGVTPSARGVPGVYPPGAAAALRARAR